MFDAAVPTDTASTSDWNPSRFADTSPLAHWLNFKCGLGELVAREKVRVARALRSLPLIDTAFERGEISYSKVRAMTRAATETSNEPEPAAIVSAETNGLETGPETDAETGAGTDKSVSAETSADEPVNATVSPAPIRTGRATALIHIAEHYLATGGSGARPLTSSKAYQVFVHVNANDAGPDNRMPSTIYPAIDTPTPAKRPGQLHRSRLVQDVVQNAIAWLS